MTHSCQRGVALISVLLVTSLALFVVAGLMRSHRMTVQGTAQQLHQQQLRQAALTAESYASQLLGRTGHSRHRLFNCRIWMSDWRSRTWQDASI
jgi:general secretion pathway protein K